jgi:uncharacterized membrane protein YhhN
MLVLVPRFLKAAWPEKTNKSLLLKMICATLFVALALLQVSISGNDSHFAQYMLWGFVLSWFGDLFLHLRFKPKALYYGLGVAAFFAGHVMFVSAYAHASSELLSSGFWNPWELGAIALLFAAVLSFLLFKLKTHKNKFFPVLMVYAVAILTMMVKAVSLALRLAIDGQLSPLGAALLALGGVCFLVSDALLLLIDFGGKDGKPSRFKTFKLKSVNIWTYFVAQILLAFTIDFIVA